MSGEKEQKFAEFSDLKRLDATHDNAESLSQDVLLGYCDEERHAMNFDDKIRSDLEINFENEKQDIIKGFIIEKKIINQDHERDKKNLINRFVKEREIILKDFQKQLEKIESRLLDSSKTNSGCKDNPDLKQLHSIEPFTRSLNADKLFWEQKPQQQTPKQNFEASEKRLFVRLDGSRTIRPEEFISNFEMEEKLESEKESLERSFRKEKERIRDILELEYERKFLREKLAHENEIKSLHSDIDHLKDLRNEVGSLWKGQASKLEAQFQNERMELEKHYIEEIERVKRKLERRHSYKLKEQQREYDECIAELKTDLKKLKTDLYETSLMSARSSEDLKEKLLKEFQEQFYNETKEIRERNERLMDEVTTLTKEKADLTRRIRELETNKENESSTIKEYSTKLNKEYQTKFQKLISEIDRLKADRRLMENSTEALQSNLTRVETERKNLENKLSLTEKTLIDCEDSTKLLRVQNKNLSQEINTLRSEKAEIQRGIEATQEKERHARVEVNKLEEELKESTNRYTLLEREKLQHEKLVLNLRRELEGILVNQKGASTKIESFESESNRLRNLLENERNENKRLHERFQQDAELLRKKDTELQKNRDDFATLKTQFEEIQAKLEICNEKLRKSDSEKISLLEKIEKVKITTDLNHKQELISVQSKYVGEFNKRLEYVKKSYEQEIEQLKNKVKCFNSNEGAAGAISIETKKKISYFKSDEVVGDTKKQDCCNWKEFPSANENYHLQTNSTNPSANRSSSNSHDNFKKQETTSNLSSERSASDSNKSFEKSFSGGWLENSNCFSAPLIKETAQNQKKLSDSCNVKTYGASVDHYTPTVQNQNSYVEKLNGNQDNFMQNMNGHQNSCLHESFNGEKHLNADPLLLSGRTNYAPENFRSFSKDQQVSLVGFTSSI